MLLSTCRGDPRLLWAAEAAQAAHDPQDAQGVGVGWCRWVTAESKVLLLQAVSDCPRVVEQQWVDIGTVDQQQQNQCTSLAVIDAASAHNTQSWEASKTFNTLPSQTDCFCSQRLLHALLNPRCILPSGRPVCCRPVCGPGGGGHSSSCSSPQPRLLPTNPTQQHTAAVRQHTVSKAAT